MSSAVAPPPPAGPPWDAPFAEAELVFVDLEMSGLRVKDDRVLEVCLERWRGGVLTGKLSSLVRPEDHAFGNAHIHGIDPAAIEHAPTFAELAERVVALTAGAVLVAHAAAWDVAFLEAELGRAGRPIRFEHYLDTLILSRRAFALPSHRLGALAEHFGFDRGRAHRADDDVNVLRQVFDRVVSVLVPTTPRDLWHVRIAERHARPEIVAAAVRACDSEATVVVRYRRSRHGPQEMKMKITAVKTDENPPRILGYDLSSRARHDLRADRILAIEPG